MRSQTYRVIRAVVLVGFLFLAARSAFADLSDAHQYDTEALAHCEAEAPAAAAAWFSNVGSPSGYTYGPKPCVLNAGGNGYSCKFEYQATGGSLITRGCCRVNNSASSCVAEFHDTHLFSEIAPSCPENGVDYPGGMQYPLDHPGTLCFGGACQVRPIGQAVCVNGVCLGQVEFTGQACQEGDPNTGTGEDGNGDGEDDDAPAGCSTVNGVLTCDCNANPGAWFCQQGDDANNCTVNANGSVTCVGAGDPENPGDTGDPSNPQNPGTGNDGGGEDDSGDGSGHGDGEGGSATSSGDCTVQPTCTGSADQCATLVQVWRSSCELVNPQGNKPPWEDDPDYGRDLKTEAELINVEGQLDASGIGGGDCPANPNISVLGTDIELDISAMCDVTGIIRVFVILMGWLTAAFIVYRAF